MLGSHKLVSNRKADSKHVDLGELQSNHGPPKRLSEGQGGSLRNLGR